MVHYTALEEVPCHMNIRSPQGYADEEITGVIAESIASHREFAQRRLAAYVERCITFEQCYGMSTETFLGPRSSDRPLGSHETSKN